MPRRRPPLAGLSVWKEEARRDQTNMAAAARPQRGQKYARATPSCPLPLAPARSRRPRARGQGGRRRRKEGERKLGIYERETGSGCCKSIWKEVLRLIEQLASLASLSLLQLKSFPSPAGKEWSWTALRLSFIKVATAATWRPENGLCSAKVNTDSGDGRLFNSAGMKRNVFAVSEASAAVAISADT